MKNILLLLAALAALTAARPQAEVAGTANPSQFEYNYKYQLKDSSAHEEIGELRSFPEDHQTIVVRGSYTYVDKDGKTYTVKYVADEFGYRPEGDHLP